MYNINEKTLQLAYKQFDKTPEIVDEDIQSLRKWMTTQDFPEIMDEATIRNLILLSKYNLEKVKSNIENYYAVRSKYLDLFENSNPNSSYLKDFVTRGCLVATHPQLMEDLYRVTFIKLINLSDFDPVDGGKMCFNIMEIRLHDDLMVGDIFVIDLAELKLKDIFRVSLSFLIHCFNVYRSVFSMRLRAGYYINCPSYIGLFMQILRLALTKKLMKRIHVSATDDIVKTLFSEEDLPQDYGGKGPSVLELNEMMIRKYEEYEERFKFLDTLVKK